MNEECINAFLISEKTCPQCGMPHTPPRFSFVAKYYFKLSAPLYATREQRNAILSQFVIYMGVVLGIAFGHYVQGGQPQVTKTVDFLLAAFMGFVILPSVFQDGTILPDAPFTARFGVAIQRGAFSDIVIEAAEKTLLQ